VSTLREQLGEGKMPNSHLIAIIVIAGFFGFFASVMTITSIRYVFLNMTNVDMLGYESKVYQLAVLVGRGTRSNDNFSTITYPLPRIELGINGEANHRPVPGTEEGNTPGLRPHTSHQRSRDNLAIRTFAILRTESGENPWDIGYWNNWKAVMGNNIFDWMLPLRKSPCVNHESHEGFYPMGHVLTELRRRYGLADPSVSEESALEMRELRKDNKGGRTT
jgi:palmitoyltransferase